MVIRPAPASSPSPSSELRSVRRVDGSCGWHHRRLWAAAVAVALAVGAAVSLAPRVGSFETNRWPMTAVGGFATRTGDGFWVVYANGAVENHGDAQLYGDASGEPLSWPVVAGAAAPDGNGYWLAAQDGGVFGYGSAEFFGSMGGSPLNAPIESIAPTASGKGYLLVASDGGVFAFGDAVFRGSTGGLLLRQPIVGVLSSADENGYRLVAADGGIFTFGSPTFFGSLPAIGDADRSDVAAAVPSSTGRGYWIVTDGSGDGVSVIGFGDAAALPGASSVSCEPVVAAFSHPGGYGLRLVHDSGATSAMGRAPGGRQSTGPLGLCHLDRSRRGGQATATGGRSRSSVVWRWNSGEWPAYEAREPGWYVTGGGASANSYRDTARDGRGCRRYADGIGSTAERIWVNPSDMTATGDSKITSLWLDHNDAVSSQFGHAHRQQDLGTLHPRAVVVWEDAWLGTDHILNYAIWTGVGESFKFYEGSAWDLRSVGVYSPPYHVESSLRGSRLEVKVWAPGTPEPISPQFTAELTSEYLPIGEGRNGVLFSHIGPGDYQCYGPTTFESL